MLDLAIVSIHAPVKVRTYTISINQVKTRVSIHAPVKVRTRAGRYGWLVPCFNPRTREGANNMDFVAAVMPARFNPRTREGANVPVLLLASQ